MKKLIVLLALIIFISCNSNAVLTALEQAETPWNISTVYSMGDLANENNIVYKSLQNNNVGYEPIVSPMWWSKE